MAKKMFLDFEQPIAELESKIDELRYVQSESAVNISQEIEQLSKKSLQLTKDIYSNLSAWQITKIARHPERPYTLEYVQELFSDFVEMHAGRGRGSLGAVQRPGEDARRAGLARATHAGEEIGLVDTAALLGSAQGVGQGLHAAFLPHEVGQHAGAIFEGEGGHGSTSLP